jgi:hypothetical protein
VHVSSSYDSVSQLLVRVLVYCTRANRSAVRYVSSRCITITNIVCCMAEPFLLELDLSRICRLYIFGVNVF